MAADVAPELLAKIKANFNRKAEYYKRLAVNRIHDGTATLGDAHEYGENLGEALSASLSEALTEDVLPNGRLYWNITDRTIRPMLENNHILVNEMAIEIQRSIDEKEGIGLSVVSGELPKERIAGLVDKAASAEDYEHMRKWLGEPIVNCTAAFFDSFVKANAEARYKAGMSPKIIRKAAFKCCDWCAGLAGTYDYEDVRATGSDVYRRHEYCKCETTFVNGRERQDVWSKKTWQADAKTLQARKTANIDVRRGVADAQKRWTEAEKADTIDRAERFAERIAENPKMLSAYTPKGFKAALENVGFEVKPLNDGSFKGVAFEDGGGFKVNFSDGGVIMYHPAEQSHHGGAYYKISTGKGGKHRYDTRGNEKRD